MDPEIVGRGEELAAVQRLVGSADPGLRALVLEGEPGIGKSTVWQAALAQAGGRVLACRAAQAEAKLAFTALADLLAGEPADELPEPQRHALDVALLRVAPGPAPADARAVGAATHSLLARAGVGGPIILAIDDVQWLDRASAAAIAFALRRLTERPLRVLLTARTGARPAELERALAGRVEHLRLGPLSLGGVHHLIRARLGHVFPRPTLRRIAQTSGGNPLFALELARVLLEAGALPGPGEPLPVPDTLAALLQARVHRLSAATRDALVAAALLSDPAEALIVEALGRGAADALAAGERADVIGLAEGRVGFRHPLLASAVQSDAAPQRRAALHRALARVVRTPEERARHLALAARGPDEPAAGELDNAAREADARGAPEVAIELAELALRLTEAAGAREERTLALAQYRFRAGDGEEGRRLVETVIRDAPPGPLRARALERMARVLHVAGTAPEAAAHCEQALAEAGEDLPLQARIHATCALVSWHDFELGRRHAAAALELLERLDEPDPAVLSQALSAYVESELYSGRPLPMAEVERGLALERLAPAPDVSDRMSAMLGVWLKLEGDLDEARRWLTETHRTAIAEGDEGSLPYAVGHLAQLELWAGNWAQAERLAHEHLELAEAMAQPDQHRQALYNLAAVLAHQGRADAARDAAQDLLENAERAQEVWGLSNALLTLGFLELSLGRPAEAAAVLERGVELRRSIGTAEPFRSFADYAEALIELGELERAEAVVGEFEAHAHKPPSLAVAARCRGRLAAERQDLDGALAALALLPSMPFDRARSLLTLGEVLRRSGRRRAAADALTEARDAFVELGAGLWAARAEADLRRIPIRRGSGEGLTATEEQVAQLVAAGRTNREVAQALFMAPKTVEANLSRIYRKLAIHSRAELGAKVAERNAAKP